MNLIYKIVNTENNKVYVGQTWQTLRKRLTEHKYAYKKTNSIISNAINKYGIDKFRIELLTVAHTQEIADYWECYFIERYNSIDSGYNIKYGGSHGKHTEETIEKIKAINVITKPIQSQKRKDYWENHPEERKKVGDFMKTEEGRKKISNARKGKPHPHKGSPRKGIRWSKKLNKINNLQGRSK
jgi:group I intron endonuclease